MGPPRRAAGGAGQLRRRPAWALYLVGGAAVIMAYYLVPAVSLLPAWTPRLVLYQGLSISAAVAILAGVQQHRPPQRRPWYLLAVSQFVYASADATFYVSHDVLHQRQFPALADLLYLSHYPILMAGLLLLVRQRTPTEDRASLIDAAVIALAAGLLSWLFLIGPLALGSDAQLSILGKVASVAYPVADLLVFAVAARLLLGPGTRPVSYWLLSASLLVVLATDTVYVLMQLTGTYMTGNFLDASWLGSYVLLGAAALHPSMRVLSEPSETPRTHTSRWRLGLLAVASLVAPATLVIPTTLGRAVNLPVIAGASAVLFLLVVARLGELVDEQRRAAVTDGLTGLYNRRFFEATLALEAEHAFRSGQDLGLLVVDIDHFKRINDAHGHQAGDRVLRELAARLVASSRDGDVIAGYGGEEFVVLLRNTSVQAVPETAERLRRAVGDAPVVLADDIGLATTISVGGAAWPVHARSADELVRVADQALYAAKRLGRNRVQIGRPPGGTAVVQERDEDAVLTYLQRLADEIDARLASEEHSAAIARWAGMIADRLGLGPDARWRAELAGRLHDIGKIIVTDEILLKPGPLTGGEWAVLRRHPVQGARLVGLAEGLHQVAAVVRHHHERFDGTGYPDGRTGEEIRIESRVVAVCDAWAAIRSNRPYDAARPVGAAREQLRVASGSQFDPTVVAAFLELEQAGVIGTFEAAPVRSSTARLRDGRSP
jgi:two-component system, cell cycle response regulator